MPELKSTPLFTDGVGVAVNELSVDILCRK